MKFKTLISILSISLMSISIVNCSVSGSKVKEKRSVASQSSADPTAITVAKESQRDALLVEQPNELANLESASDDDIITNELKNIWSKLNEQKITEDSNNKWLSKYQYSYSGHHVENAYTQHDVPVYDFLYMNRSATQGKYTRIQVHYVNGVLLNSGELRTVNKKVAQVEIYHGNFRKVNDHITSISYLLPNVTFNSQSWNKSSHSQFFDLYEFTYNKYNVKHYYPQENHYRWDSEGWDVNNAGLLTSGIRDNNLITPSKYYLVSKHRSSSSKMIFVPVTYNTKNESINTQYPLNNLQTLKDQIDELSSQHPQYYIFNKIVLSSEMEQ